jgi:hypothetical protein
MAMRSLGYMPSEVELAIIMQRLDMDGKADPPLNFASRDLGSSVALHQRSGDLSLIRAFQSHFTELPWWF